MYECMSPLHDFFIISAIYLLKNAIIQFFIKFSREKKLFCKFFEDIVHYVLKLF